MLKSDGKEYKLKWSPETFSAVAPPQVALSERNNSIKKKEKRKERKKIGLHGRLNNFAQLMEANRSKFDSGFSFQFHKIGPM